MIARANIAKSEWETKNNDKKDRILKFEILDKVLIRFLAKTGK